MRDVFDNEIQIGDTVAFIIPRCRGLMTGIVLSFTPKMVKIEYTELYVKNPDCKKCLVYPRDVVVRR